MTSITTPPHYTVLTSLTDIFSAATVVFTLLSEHPHLHAYIAATQTRHAINVKRNIEARSRNHCCRWKAILGETDVSRNPRLTPRRDSNSIAPDSEAGMLTSIMWSAFWTLECWVLVAQWQLLMSVTLFLTCPAHSLIMCRNLKIRWIVPS
jgi:hypothetical protein